MVVNEKASPKTPMTREGYIPLIHHIDACVQATMPQYNTKQKQKTHNRATCALKRDRDKSSLNLRKRKHAPMHILSDRGVRVDLVFHYTGSSCSVWYIHQTVHL